MRRGQPTWQQKAGILSFWIAVDSRYLLELPGEGAAAIAYRRISQSRPNNPNSNSIEALFKRGEHPASQTGIDIHFTTKELLVSLISWKVHAPPDDLE